MKRHRLHGLGAQESRFCHGGRRERQEEVNVDSERFHEGRSARKKTTPGGHDIVSRKKLLQKKRIVGGKRRVTNQMLFCLKRTTYCFFGEGRWISFSRSLLLRGTLNTILGHFFP